MEFVKAQEIDLDQIIKIEEENFLDLYRKKDFLYELKENPFSNFYVVKDDNKIYGYIIFWITFETSTLCRICVENLKKYQGLGSFLLENAEKILIKNKVESMSLEVRESNLSAINFYKKHGFIKIFMKEHYYANGENALYMMKGY